jgi:hypothetical protein
MSLSQYLTYLVDKAMLSQGVAEAINKDYPEEADQYKAAKDYIALKNHILERNANVTEDCRNRLLVMKVFDLLGPYKAYLENKELEADFEKMMIDLPILWKKLGNPPCIWCGDPFTSVEDHTYQCLMMWAAISLSDMLRNWEAAGKATPEDKANRIELDKKLEEISANLDALKKKAAAPKGETPLAESCEREQRAGDNKDPGAVT